MSRYTSAMVRTVYDKQGPFHLLNFYTLPGEARADTCRELEQQGIRLREGLILTLSTDDADDQGRPDEMRAEGIVHYDEVERCWVAAIDWGAIRHASEEATRTAGR